jgi:hypothetical protein
MPLTVILDNAALTPREWRFCAGPGPVWAFNPALAAEDGGGWLLAPRLVFRDQVRRIAICRLDPEFRVVEGSAVPLSDLLRLPASAACDEVNRKWFADPRLYWLAGRLFLQWNTGWHATPNAQFLQELDAATLEPTGQAQELRLQGVRQTIEKNWMLFGGDPVRAVYFAKGQRILRAVTAGQDAILFAAECETNWNPGVFVREYGSLRGGAPPCLHAGRYYSFCHARRSCSGRDSYVAAVYTFGEEPPFAPLARPCAPLALANPWGERALNPKLAPNVGEVIYACGTAWRDGKWVVGYGINNERCAIAQLDATEVDALLGAVELSLPPARSRNERVPQC